jgi:hypothetical protein
LPRIIREELDYDGHALQAMWEDGYNSANADPRAVLDAVQDALSRNGPRLFFIDGPGGTGKTFLGKPK